MTTQSILPPHLTPKGHDMVSAYKDIKTLMTTAALTAGRAPESISLIAISKTKPVSLILTAYELGQRRFGENYIQECIEKCRNASLASLPLQWHITGHVQSNKVKYLFSPDILPKLKSLDTLDRLSLAEALQKACEKAAHRLPVLLEVNISGQSSKAGIAPQDLMRTAEALRDFPLLTVEGLMTLASADLHLAEREFKEMKRLFEDLKSVFPHVTRLSMGMSNDFTQAIAHGATEVRIGSRLFGER